MPDKESLVELLRLRAAERPDDHAFTFLRDGEADEARLSYRQLDERARAVAATLQEAGGAGERALLLYPPGPEYLVAFFGCLYAGTVAVPVYPPRPGRGLGRLLSILGDAGARFALGPRALLDGAVGTGSEPGSGGAPPELGVVQRIATDELAPDAAAAWHDPGAGPSTLAFLQYTSGSTAEPKGVMLTHGNLLHNLELIRRGFGVEARDVGVIWLPPYHDMGLIGGLLEPIYTGFPAVLLPPMSFLQKPIRWLAAVSRYRATVSGGPNFAYDLAARKVGASERAALDLSSWTLAFNGAEPIRAATLERFARAFAPCGFRPEAFYPCYGLAEATLFVTGAGRGAGARVETFSSSELARHRAVRGGTVGDRRELVASGRCPEGQRVVIVDPDIGAECAPGQVGEVWIAGPSVARGYWRRRELTAEAFGARLGGGPAGGGDETPFLRTGDLGFLDGGLLYVTGRSKDLMILRGRNVYPQDVEATVEAAHPALRAGGCAAFSVDPDEAGPAAGGGEDRGEERLVVVQEVRREALRDDLAGEAGAVAAAVRRAVAEEHEAQLHALVLIRPSTLPKTSSGKVRRRATREAYLAGSLDAVWRWVAGEEAVEVEGAPDAAAPPEAPAAPAEAEVRAWLAAEVGRHAGVSAASVDVHAPVADHGLDSLGAMEVAHAVESRFGVPVPMERLLEGATVAELVAELVAAEPDRATPAAAAPVEKAPAGDLPLSRNQLSLWFLHALEPESPAYNVPAAVRVRGPLSRDLLVRALELLVARHPSLRTRFAVVRGEPRQRVSPEPEVAIWEEDARGWSERELKERLRVEARRPFDLEGGTLFRAGLLQRSRLEHVLFLSMHHAVTDFWSLGVLLDELGAAYAALEAGREPSLPPAPAPYSRFVEWQEELLAGPRGRELEDYWTGRLAGQLPVLELHTDRPRPRVQGYEGGAVPLFVPAHRSSELRALGRRHRATPFMLLATAFEALLARYTGQTDVLLGTVSAGRSRAELARTVGYFVNPVVLRAEVSDDLSFDALLERTRRGALAAFEHQDYPFALLVERLQPDRDPGRSPLFQAMLVFQRAELSDGQDLTAFALAGAVGNGVDRSTEGRPQLRIGGLHLESQPLDLGIAQFDLTLTVGEVAGAFTGTLDYNRDLFDESTARRMAGHLVNLMTGVATDPGRALSELPLLAAAERRQLVVDWNDTRTPYRRKATLVELVEEQVERTPDREAVIAEGRSLTYRELDLQANRLAHHLRRRGVGPESVVGVLFERSPELMVAILGVLKAGGAYLPLDADYPRERLVWTLDDATVRVLVTEERLAGLFHPGPGQVIVRLDGDQELIESESPARPEPRLGADANPLACVIYTSGSTGEPKGVLLEHRSLVNLVSSFLRTYEPGTDDRILPLTSLAHASFVGEIFPLLAAGGAVVLPSREELLETAALLKLVARHQVSILSTVPSLLATLNAVRDDLPRLRLILVGGEALSAGDVDRLIGSVSVMNGYGLTEAGICTSVHPVTADEIGSGAKPRIGKPVMNTRVYVLDSGLRLQPAGVPGEIYVAGDGLARAYWRRPGLTAERFRPDPFAGGRLYKTGDLGAWAPDGTLEYLGRIDHQVKVRGFRIELGEIESVLAIHTKVQEAAVAVHGEGSEARLVGYVVAAGESAPTPGELLAHLRERLPDYMVPADLVFLPALPLLPSGKVDLAALPAPPAERAGTAPYRAPRSELERRIAAVWSRALGASSVGLDDNFFDLGGHSLLMTRVHAELVEELAPELAPSGRKLSLLELFKFPTVGSLAAHLAGGEPQELAPREERRVSRRRAGDMKGYGDVAIVGVAGRFPGAQDPDGLWRNLAAGVESITFFRDEELLAAGVDPELLANPDYVKAKGVLGDVDLFDAELFGLNPREVELMDPQHRLFLECCWEALERAGYDPERYDGSVGVYGGESMNTYLLTNLLSHLELVASVDTLQASLGNDKDPLTSRVAYKLNLKGPSITIQSASSTSLVAVHVACQSVLHGHCDMALAGGVSIHLPEVSGYMYQDGGTTARDGHTRAFDASSTGFVSGHGAGVVVLKRLEAALADGDHVHAVIKSAACNNDGSLKVSFMAPSVDGQVEVYTRAYEEAGVSPDTLGYVECHGTGTALGDPIEITALTQAFSRYTERRGFCAIGSLKTNVGHLDTAAGVCGLIKATLALENRAIPPSLHFERPNPRIDFDGSPFFVNTAFRPWERSNGVPRRAAVTSLGMGGTNAHVVLEEAPERAASGPSRPCQLLVVSAKTGAAADAAVARLAARLAERPETPLADVAYTLQVGRKAFPHRRMLLCREPDEAAAALADRDPERLLSGFHRGGDRPVAFLFPGQGAQYPDMGRGLYEAEASFRADVDRCAEVLTPLLGLDLREVLFPDAGETSLEAAAERLRRTELTQPALFAVSWATARLWMRWGVRPDALIGHSIGELAAACVAGVLTLEDALAMVAARGNLMSQMPAGAMLAVPLPEEETRALVAEAVAAGAGGSGELDLAAMNRPGVTVVSGSEEGVAELAARLEAREIEARWLHTSHAFHSWMMDPIVPAFVEAVKGVRLEPPRIPYLSNVTGTWIRPEEATDPAYWGRQLRGAVRYADGVATLLAEPERVLLETGPGNTLATLSRQHPDRRPSHAILSSLRHPKESRDDLESMLDAAGRLWLAGGEIDWGAFWQGEDRRRVPLPTYPFERQRYWVEPLPDAARKPRRAEGRSADPGDWTWAPAWHRVPLPARPPAPSPPGSGSAAPALILGDPGPRTEAFARALEERGHRVTVAEAGEGFERSDDGRFRVRPGDADDLDRLLDALDAPPGLVLHQWATTGSRRLSRDELLARSLHSLIELAPRWATRLSEAGAPDSGPAVLAVVSDGVHEVTGGETLEPLKATLLGACGTIPREYPEIACRHLDLEAEPAAPEGDLAGSVLSALAAAGAEPADALAASTALRGRHLWARGFERVRMEPVETGALPVSFGGTCLVTGGLGGIGLELAAALAREAAARGARCRLALLGRSPLPEGTERDAWLAAHPPEDRTRRRIEGVRELEALGAEVLVCTGDVSSAAALRAVEAAAAAGFGPEDGRVRAIVHAAGVPGGALLRGRTAEAAAAVLAPKVGGTLALEEVFGDRPLDFFVLCSSVTGILPEMGQADYAAANAFLDAFAAGRNARGGAGSPTVALSWDVWREVGMAVETEVPAELAEWRRKTLERGIDSAGGAEVFRRALAAGLPQVAVSTIPWDQRLEEHRSTATPEALEEAARPAAAHARPELANPYTAPEGELELAIAGVWQELLGIDRVGAHDNFFDLGGNSLAGLRIIRGLKERLGDAVSAGLSDVSLYEAPTVAALARLLGDGAGPEEPATPAADEHRARGERRKARMMRKRGVSP